MCIEEVTFSDSFAQGSLGLHDCTGTVQVAKVLCPSPFLHRTVLHRWCQSDSRIPYSSRTLKDVISLAVLDSVAISIYSNHYSSMNENRFFLDYVACRTFLLQRVREPAPGRIQILTGPRQVGKTTLLLELAHDLGLYFAGDPAAGLPGFWERVWPRPRSGPETVRQFCYWIKCISWRTGALTLKATMIVSVASGSRSMSSSWDRQRYA